MGGGRGGNGAQSNGEETQGSSGNTSSFGSFVSAPGGNDAVSVTGITPPISGEQHDGSLGSDGEHGWGSMLWYTGSMWSPSLDYDLLACISAIGALYEVRNGGKTDLAENGYAFARDATSAGGRGGLGYGAGGGGGAYASSNSRTASCGGKAGTVKIASVKLTKLNAITVTVGTGGAGGDASSAKGGAGANGCVAVFW